MLNHELNILNASVILQFLSEALSEGRGKEGFVPGPLKNFIGMCPLKFEKGV